MATTLNVVMDFIGANYQFIDKMRNTYLAFTYII